MRFVLVIVSDDGLPVIPWARSIASTSGGSLSILCLSRDSTARCSIVKQPAESTPPLVRAVWEAANRDGVSLADVYDCRGVVPHKAALDACRAINATQLVLHASVRSGAHSLTLRLARVAPFETFVLDTGACVAPARRVVVPQYEGGGGCALSAAARRFACDGCTVLAIPDPEALTRSRRVHQAFSEKAGVPTQVTSGEAPIDEALRETVRAGDLVLIDVERPSSIPCRLAALSALHAERNVDFAVGVVRAVEHAVPTRGEAAAERFRSYAPVLTRDQRRDLHALLDDGGRLSTDFVVMLTLSAAIASLGLIQSSSSVVIGAMLVAPLMTPLVAIGMALTQGNARLFRVATSATTTGVLGALAVSMVVGALSPWDDLSAEVVARGSPNVFDLGIALLSGIAASFALARPGLAGTLVGVAIAVALLPPLAATGIATVKAHFNVAGGAAMLFLTNLLAIVVGSALVFRLFGVDPSVRGAATPPWVRNVLVGVASALALTTGLLGHNLDLQIDEGVHRPYARPLPSSLRSAIQARVAREPGVEIVFMAQSDIEHGFGVEVAIAASEDVDARLVDDVKRLVTSRLGVSQPVRVLLLRSLGERENNTD